MSAMDSFTGIDDYFNFVPISGQNAGAIKIIIEPLKTNHCELGLFGDWIALLAFEGIDTFKF